MKWLTNTVSHWDDTELPNYIRFRNILSLSVQESKIEILEECDQYFRETVEPAEAIEMFQEFIDWIKENCEVKDA